MKMNFIKSRRKKAALKRIPSKLIYEPFYKTLKTFHERIPDFLESSESAYFESTLAQTFKGIQEAEPIKVEDMEDSSLHRIRKRSRAPLKKLNYKIDIIGKQGVGVSTLVNSYSHTIFPDSYMNTVGVDFYLKEISFNGTSCILQLWTHSNEDRFKPLRLASLADTNGLIIIYDLTDLTSLQVIHEWVPLIRAKDSNIPIMLLGNKLDLNDIRRVQKDDITPLLKKYNIHLSYEISALIRVNVDFIFNTLLLSILEKDVDSSSNKNGQTTQTTFKKIEKASKSYNKKLLK
jgi:small GTP-binding protein